MKCINLLESYPRIKRPIATIIRSTPENMKISQQFGYEYFDGDRKYGYGGYKYDGRWVPIARKFIEYYGLKSGDSVLDVGCAKGFLLYDLKSIIPGLVVKGLDISKYAIDNTISDMKPFCDVGNAKALPYPDKSFDLVISINTIHNLDYNNCEKAIREIVRVSKKNAYIQIDSWLNEEQRNNLLNWRLTALTMMPPEGWEYMLKECDYNGEYSWTITE